MRDGEGDGRVCGGVCVQASVEGGGVWAVRLYAGREVGGGVVWGGLPGLGAQVDLIH